MKFSLAKESTPLQRSRHLEIRMELHERQGRGEMYLIIKEMRADLKILKRTQQVIPQVSKKKSHSNDKVSRLLITHILLISICQMILYCVIKMYAV